MPEDVWDKVKEEILEAEIEIKKGNTASIEKEFGDILFSIINAARLYKVNADNALEATNRKFIRRFNFVEERVKEAGRALNDMTLQEMDELWNKAKVLEKKNTAE